MPSSGISLVGFLDQHQAVNHLANPCVPSTPDPNTLLLDWQLARGKLGAPVVNAGCPAMTEIPATHAYISMLLASSVYGPALQHYASLGMTFQQIEIDPLLAFQLTVDTDRSNHHCASVARPPTESELFSTCLPATQPQDVYHASLQGQSIIIRSRSLNLQLINQGPLQGLPNALGIQFNWSLPLVHVVRYEGRCYLHNGYHRAFGMRTAGATCVPCVFRDVSSPAEVGINPGTFQMPLLESQNPPTMKHFTDGRAFDVKLRAASRILQVSWSDHVLYEE